MYHLLSFIYCCVGIVSETQDYSLVPAKVTYQLSVPFSSTFKFKKNKVFKN